MIPPSIFAKISILNPWVQPFIERNIDFEAYNVAAGALVSTFGAILVSLRRRSSAEETGTDQHGQNMGTDHLRRQKRLLCERVNSFWIDGGLLRSLQDGILLNPKLSVTDISSEYEKWGEVVRPSAELHHYDCAGIDYAFRESGGSLLLLGEAGSGKTTLLLELVRHELTRENEDSDKSTPVVLFLSYWAKKRKPIRQWIIEELKLKYGVPHNLGRSLIDRDELILFFDGLDEVPKKHREECLKELNRFLDNHITPAIVSCRLSPYKELHGRLHLRRKVVIQDLSLENVDDYLSELGESVQGIREAISKNEVIQELVRIPLMLNIFISSYQGRQIENITLNNYDTASYAWLFDAYIDRMFDRHIRTYTSIFPKDKTIAWLSRLARTSFSWKQEFSYSDLVTGKQKDMYIFGNLFGAFGILVLFCIIGVLVAYVNPLVATAAESFEQWVNTHLVLITVFMTYMLFSVGGLFKGLADEIWGDVWTHKNFRTYAIDRLPTMVKNGEANVAARFVHWTYTSRIGDLIGCVGCISCLPLSLILLPIFMIIAAGALLIFSISFFKIIAKITGIFYLASGLQYLHFLYSQHLLRTILALSGYLPWRFHDFLEYSVERMFMYRTGNSYTFIHDSVRHHFAGKSRSN